MPSRHMPTAPQLFGGPQGVPWGTGVNTQPTAGSQLSAVQSLLSLQTGGGSPVQVPFWQVSAPLQALPSEHEVPFGTAACVQLPVAGSHTSAVQGLPSSQLFPPLGWHTPAWQDPVEVQAPCGVQAVPSGTAVNVQPVTGSQLFAVQGLLSSHVSGVPALHTPFLHVSPPLHTLPSEHEIPFLAFLCLHWNFVDLSQMATVHGLWSSRVIGHAWLV